jgi:hypothetical protein
VSSLISAIPQNVYITTGNGQVCLNWNVVAGAAGYVVNRSIDGVNYTLLAMPSVNSYVDSTVSTGTQYWYQVASTSAAGTSAFQSYGSNSLQLSIIPAPAGQISLGYLRYQARLRADQLKSNFVTQDEWNIMINQSKSELYDLLVTKFGEDYFLAPPLILTSASLQAYPLPNGQNYLQINGLPNPSGTPAPACYKVYGMDLNSYGAALNNPQGWRSMSRFNWADRNKYNFLLGAASNNVSGQYCQFQYREMGTNVYILPINSGQYFRLWYVPLDPDLLQDTDMLSFSYSGWYEYVVVDVAAKALAKQEFYEQAQELMARKADLMVRIETTAANRDVGQPNTATNSRAMLGDPNFGGGNGFGFGNWSAGGWGY